MRIILNEEVKNIGHRGDVKNVADGYARNFLIPKGLAYQHSPANLSRFNQEKKKYEQKMLKEKAVAEEAGRALEAVSLRISRRVGEQEALYGSVTAADIAAELAKNGIELDKRKIELGEPIKKLGTYEFPVRLHRDVTAKLAVEVVAEEA